jgi:6-pyruvoyltetrahydropterin/6-carboxytetrahydropterin synthase
MENKTKMRIGVENLRFHAIHYTPGESSKCKNLHGHTFFVDVEVEGILDEYTGMVMDFLKLKRIVHEVLNEYDHKIILPEIDSDKVVIEGPFGIAYKKIEYPFATTEYLALSIAKEVYKRVGLKTRVRVYEGADKYAEVTYNG